MPAQSISGFGPSQANVVRILKNGYWDRTEVIELADSSRRVRKRTKGATGPGPWSIRSLRREIAYLGTLPLTAKQAFPQMLHAWDCETEGGPDVGYEMPYFSDHQDAGVLARGAKLTQVEIDLFQDHLGDAVIGGLHVADEADEPLSVHLTRVVHEAFADLRRDPELIALIDADRIRLNGEECWGPRAAFDQIQGRRDALAVLDMQPTVRLHGDFCLENILWLGEPGSGYQPRLVLIDPVSVAGVFAGPAVFDLVKYESYAKGELLALRSAWVEVSGFQSGESQNYQYRIRWDDEGLRGFRMYDWHSRFRRAFEAKHGPIDLRTYHLIDGYFSAAMAVNTSGAQRHARLLKATAEFNAVLGTA